MRRPPPEWLLAPVFALPLLAAAALAIWARHDYFARTEPFSRDGEALARRWIERDPDGVRRVAAEFDAALPTPRISDDGWAAFRRPTAGGVVEGFVRVKSARAPQTAWNVASDFPAGLRPAALADANVRIAIESGLAPSRNPGADAGTVAFRKIVETRDAALLRSAPLPASTKLYLLRRAFDGKPDSDADALATLVAFERSFPGRVPPGAHAAQGVVALVAHSGATLLFRDADEIPRLGPFPLGDDTERDVRLAWSPVARDADVAWRGRLDAPLAGEWSFVLPHGDRWWRSDAYNWLLPAAVGCLAFLFVPTALLVAIRRRRKLDEARARFVNELAHDLRTPVTSLRLHAEMLSEGRVPKGEEPRYLDVLGRETARLSSLLANLLDLSRLERGARGFESRPTDVGEVVLESVREFATLHPKRAEDVTVAIDRGLVADADRTALARCLANLLDNAGKFTKEGTPIRVAAERADGARVRIVVADEGEGVPRAERSRVFELYERGAAARNAAPGTGLGLALVRELVAGMRGAVALVDAPRGARFEFFSRRRRMDETRRILVVEDEESIREALADALRSEGYEVLVAADGRQGLDLGLTQDPDLVVLDLMLPGIDGFEVLRRLRADHVETPVLVVTARGLEDDRVRGLDLGADDYMVKPFALAELLARIRARLRAWDRERGVDSSHVLRFGGVVVDFDARSAVRDGRDLRLSPKEFELLQFLADHDGRALSRAELLRGVWADEEVVSRVIDTAVLGLRKKIERDPARPRHVVSVRGTGYRFDRRP